MNHSISDSETPQSDLEYQTKTYSFRQSPTAMAATNNNIIRSTVGSIDYEKRQFSAKAS